MPPALWISLLIWSAVLKVVLTGEQCFIWEDIKFKYCEWGCCGGEFDTYCCFPIGLIIGACVGGLFITTVVISVVCCCVKKKGRAGQVIGTASTTPVQVVGQQVVGQQVVGHKAYPTMPMQQMSPGGPVHAPVPGIMPPPYPVQPSPGPPGPGLYDDPAYPPVNPPPYK